MGLKKHLWFLFVLLALGLFAMKTFWGPEYFDGHDAQAHIVRLYQYDLALKDGQFPPRWAGGLLAGRGYPVFIFAYPLPYALAEGFHFLGFSLAVSLKLVFVLAYLASGLAAYYFASQYWRSRLAGFISALLWSWAPYIFVKIFVTASLGVVVSYVFIPLFFLFLYRLLEKPNLRHSLFLSLSATGWILSHEITPLVFFPLILIFFLAHWLRSDHKRLSLKFLVLSSCLALGLSAWFIVPALVELKFTHFAEFVTHAYASQFVSFERLLYSKWGTDAPGWGDNPLSQQVGVAQWLAVFLAWLWFLIKRSKPRQILPFILSYPLAIFLMLKISQPVWDKLPLLPLVHIPWRFLSLAVFTAALCAGYLVKNISRISLKFLVFSLLVLLTIYGNRNHLRINQPVVYPPEFFINYTGVATGWNEHLPIWVKEIPRTFPENKYQIISGDCQVAKSEFKSNLQRLGLDCQSQTVLQLNTAYYPGWQTWLDSSNRTEEVKQNLDQSNGMIQVTLSPGSHQLKLEFQDTPLRQVTKIVSLFSLIATVWLYFRK
jgi:uncharacterized membrane protein